MFCKICGSLLRPQNTSVGKMLTCANGHSESLKLNQEQNKENIVNIKNNPTAPRIGIMDGENRLAVHNHLCQKCGHDKAELIEMSCSYSDEDNHYRMKCGKCGFVVKMEGKTT